MRSAIFLLNLNLEFFDILYELMQRHITRYEVDNYVRRLEDYMVQHGFNREEIHDMLLYWGDCSTPTIIDDSYASHYSVFLAKKFNIDALRFQFHMLCRENEVLIVDSTQVGCFGCAKLYEPNQITTWMPGIKSRTAVCPFCHAYKVVGNHMPWILIYIPDRKKWFADRIQEAYEFWTNQTKYKLPK